MKHAFIIGDIAIRELLYERVFYVLLSFTILSLGLSLLLGQLTYSEQAKLTLDFMLAGVQISMTLFSIFMGIMLFSRELILGSVSSVLAKPISRHSFLLGKFIGQVTVQGVVIFLMGILTIALSTQFEEGRPISAISQAISLIFLEVTVLTSVTYCLAAFTGGVTTAVVTGCFFCLGHLRDSLAKNVNIKRENHFVWRLTQYVVPDLEIFNMKSLASYGLTIRTEEMLWALLYSFICVVFFLLIASLIFKYKDIPT